MYLVSSTWNRARGPMNKWMCTGYMAPRGIGQWRVFSILHRPRKTYRLIETSVQPIRLCIIQPDRYSTYMYSWALAIDRMFGFTTVYRETIEREKRFSAIRTCSPPRKTVRTVRFSNLNTRTIEIVRWKSFRVNHVTDRLYTVSPSRNRIRFTVTYMFVWFFFYFIYEQLFFDRMESS